MAEINVPACPTHGSIPRALHSENFEGIVTVIENIIETVSGVGTVSYSRCPYGYPWNFEGVVRALEDLNTSISGISGGGGGADIAAGSGIYFTTSGTATVINATVVSASGISISAGSGIYLSDAGTRINLDAVGEGSVTVLYSGTVAVISGTDTQGGGGGGASVTVSGEPRLVKAHRDFRFICTMNPPDSPIYKGIETMSFEFMDRFDTVVYLDYLSPATEAELIMELTGFSDEVAARKIVQFANTISQAMKQGEVFATVTTRSLISFCRKAQSFDIRTAAEASILRKMSTADREKATDMFNSIFR